MPDPVAKADGDAGLGGQWEQQLQVDGLDVAGVLLSSGTAHSGARGRPP
jgi:hypothetical protein